MLLDLQQGKSRDEEFFRLGVSKPREAETLYEQRTLPRIRRGRLKPEIAGMLSSMQHHWMAIELDPEARRVALDDPDLEPLWSWIGGVG